LLVGTSLYLMLQLRRGSPSVKRQPEYAHVSV
jgi:hypothetical protein